MKLRNCLLIAFVLLLASCSKVTMENYNQLKSGMKYDEVTDIIGEPDSCDENLGTRSCIWGNSEGTNIKAKFLNETAIFFSHKELK